MQALKLNNPYVQVYFYVLQTVIKLRLLPPAYVVRREGNVLTRVCLSVHRGVPISHNALQHYPECHGAARGGPCQVQGGVPWRGGVPWQGGTLGGGYPGGGTQLGQHREYLLHARRYASCVHAGGLSCSYLESWSSIASHYCNILTIVDSDTIFFNSHDVSKPTSASSLSKVTLLQLLVHFYCSKKVQLCNSRRSLIKQ